MIAVLVLNLENFMRYDLRHEPDLQTHGLLLLVLDTLLLDVF